MFKQISTNTKSFYLSHQGSTKKPTGFTLIELLLVVLIIAVLSGVVIGLLNSKAIKGKARDSQRIADLKKLQAGLELYYAQNRAYPAPNVIGVTYFVITGTDNISTLLSPNYMNKIPVDPLLSYTNASPCNASTDRKYSYRPGGAGSSYILTAIMEEANSNNGYECTGLNNWAALGCSMAGTVGDYCYGTENP